MLLASAGAATQPDPPPSETITAAPASPTSAGAGRPVLEGRPPTGVEEELESITPGVAIKREFDRIAAESNIRFGVANTLLFQQATGGPGNRTAAGGDLDLLLKWTAIGAGTPDTGILAFAAETRYQIGDQAPSALGGQIGSLIPTTNGFGERPMVVKELYWDQRLFDDRFRYAVGRIDPENLFGGHRLQSANLFFLNKNFSSNPAIAYAGPGLAAAAQFKPVPWFYIDGGVTDANGKATIGNFEGFFEDHEFLVFTEAALTPTIENLGAGRYRLALWHIDSREDAAKPSDRGVTLSFDQDLGEKITAFARFGYSDGDVTGVDHSFQAGVAFKNVVMEDDLLGLAAAWADPTGSGKRDESVAEVFHRFQVTQTAQLTIGAQAIFDPSNAPGDDVVGVFSVRLRLSF